MQFGYSKLNKKKLFFYRFITDKIRNCDIVKITVKTC